MLHLTHKSQSQKCIFFIVQRRWRVFFHLIAETPSALISGQQGYYVSPDAMRWCEDNKLTHAPDRSESLLRALSFYLHSGCALISIFSRSLICAHSIINKKLHLQLHGIGPLADPNSHPLGIRAKLLKTFRNYWLNGVINVTVWVTMQPILSD